MICESRLSHWKRKQYKSKLSHQYNWSLTWQRVPQLQFPSLVARQQVGTIVSSSALRYPIKAQTSHTTMGSSLLLFSRLVVYDSSWLHGPEHARPSYLPLPPIVVSNSCWLLRWHCPTISSSVIPFSCCHTFPKSGTFPGSLLFSWDRLSIGASSVLYVL